MIAAAQVIDEHLLDRLVVSDEDVPDGASAHEVADLFGQVLGMISGAFERLSHEDDLQACLSMNVLWILDVAQEYEVPQAVHLGVSSEYFDGLADVALRKGITAIGKHLFQKRRHLGKIAGIFGVDPSTHGLGAVAEAEQEITDALQPNHELHAGEQLTCLGRLYLGDGGGHAVVDFEVERVEFAFALAQRSEQGAGAGGNALGGGSGGLFGHLASLDRSANDVV